MTTRNQMRHADDCLRDASLAACSATSPRPALRAAAGPAAASATRRRLPRLLPVLLAGASLASGLLASTARAQGSGDRAVAPPLPVSGAVTIHDPKTSGPIGLGVSTVQEVIAALNNEPSQKITESKKAWRPIFDAYLDMTAPPMPIGEGFNVGTVHPKMKDWDKVAAWAKANQGMAKALNSVRESVGFALPYGEENVDPKYRAKGLCVRIGVDNDLRRNEYPYLKAIETIAVFAIADMYRLLEAGQAKEAFQVALDGARMLRHTLDRVLVPEKAALSALTADYLAAQRDAMWTYRDKIPTAVFKNLANDEYPFLAPKRARLEMPEGEKIVAEAIIRNLFDAAGQPDPEKFATVLGGLQSEEKPLTAFGAARNWRRLAQVHGSLDASLKKLVDVYDDWWRRWRMRQYDPIIDLPTELSRTNPIRYGAVIYAIDDIQSLFEQRKRLVAEVNAAALAAGLAGYRSEFKSDADDREKTYATFCRKASDFDPWDKGYGRFLYRYLGSEKKSIDTPNGRVWVDGGVLYARGKDLEDNDFTEVTADGSHGDMLLWPPMRAIEREQGIVAP